MSATLPENFGLWRVVGKAADARKVVCECRCGAQREVWLSNLTKGQSRCCGAPKCRAEALADKAPEPRGSVRRYFVPAKP